MDIVGTAEESSRASSKGLEPSTFGDLSGTENQRATIAPTTPIGGREEKEVV
ncbi:Myo-inositol transporter 2 [Venturia inaequalis]|nr:Myo-inositol transporter 2 [Venturia inaequalis]